MNIMNTKKMSVLENYISKQVRKQLNEQLDMFEKYEDTDLNGSGVEMVLDNLIDEYVEMIKKQIPKEDQAKMRQKIKRLWMEKLKRWVKL
jgi:valyl-tRNA synthetase